MPYLLLTLNFLLMIGLPIALGVVLARRLKQRWGLFGVGAVTFVLSQVGHIPFNALAFRGAQAWPPAVVALALGLSAGVFEESGDCHQLFSPGGQLFGDVLRSIEGSFSQEPQPGICWLLRDLIGSAATFPVAAAAAWDSRLVTSPAQKSLA